MATRLRHLAIIVPDPEPAAQFFERAFDLTHTGWIGATKEVVAKDPVKA